MVIWNKFFIFVEKFLVMKILAFLVVFAFVLIIMNKVNKVHREDDIISKKEIAGYSFNLALSILITWFILNFL